MDFATVDILGLPIAAVNMDGALEIIDDWLSSGSRNYVTVTGVHGVMESQDNAEVKKIHQQAGMCVPDGTPLAWVGWIYGYRNACTIRGSDLMREQLKRSIERGYTHFFYGGKAGVPELLQQRLEAALPGLKILGGFSPPFRPMTDHEESELRDLVARLKPDIIWVGLSTPKQEKWMAAHIDRLATTVMIGVGAAFDFHAGLVAEAPLWVHNTGMEWAYRLLKEPRRLWRRYLRNNPRFVVRIIRQLFTDGPGRRRSLREDPEQRSRGLK